MSEQKANYRTVNGIIQFPPKDGEAGGKAVRNIVVRQAGFGPTAVRVSATLWPSHAHVEVAEGDVVMMEGKYDQRTGTNAEGDPVKYHNLSVSKIAVTGKVDTGRKVDVANESAAEPEVAEDDIPF